MENKIRAFRYAIIIVLVMRLSTSLIMVVLADSYPVNDCPKFLCEPQVDVILDQMNQSWFGRYFLAPWYRWDTVHYLDKANPDYKLLGLESTVWPPLYPLLIRIISTIMPDMAAAMLISTLSSLVIFYLLYLEISAGWTEAIARKTALLLAFFPTGFFLMAGYSEALFIALSLAVFSNIRCKRWLMAGVWGALAALTRLQGIFLILPLVWEGYCMLKTRLVGKGIKDLLLLCWKDREIRLLIEAIMLILFTLVAYYFIMYFEYNAPMPWETVSIYWGRHMGWPGQGVFNFLASLLRKDYQVLSVGSVLDVSLLLLLTGVLVAKWKKMPVSFLLYGIVILVFPSLYLQGENSLMTSVARYVLAVFPAMIALALSLRRKLLYISWLGIFAVSQYFLLFCYYRWAWVA